MTKEQATENFNAMPRDIRTTIIAHELKLEIQIINREKKAAILAHAKRVKEINERIKRLEDSLSALKYD
jgi:hypothetical protein